MKTPEKLKHHHILLFDGDFDRLSELHRHRSVNEVVRLLVRKHIENVEAQLSYTKEPLDA